MAQVLEPGRGAPETVTGDRAERPRLLFRDAFGGGFLCLRHPPRWGGPPRLKVRKRPKEPNSQLLSLAVIPCRCFLTLQRTAFSSAIPEALPQTGESLPDRQKKGETQEDEEKPATPHKRMCYIHHRQSECDKQQHVYPSIAASRKPSLDSLNAAILIEWEEDSGRRFLRCRLLGAPSNSPAPRQSCELPAIRLTDNRKLIDFKDYLPPVNHNDSLVLFDPSIRRTRIAVDAPQWSTHTFYVPDE